LPAGRRAAELREFASPAEIDALPGPPVGEGFLYTWAWVDEAAGVVRTRAFPRRGDAIVEDEATGAAALLLTAELGRALTVHQGVGSEIRTGRTRTGGLRWAAGSRWSRNPTRGREVSVPC
jgi:predicted PhzF superfamily epimerase YddE/YHI9